MKTDRLNAQRSTDEALGVFLRQARLRLDPVALGFSGGRRRTPGLRREEVAQRARISVSWYICLEQGRGGKPSSDALERVSEALLLTDLEREHLFLLGLGRPPEPRYQPGPEITARLQRVLNLLDPHPAFVRSATWDMIAWNTAATELMGDFSQLAPEQRNILRLMFLDSSTKVLYPDWEISARFIVSAFRMDAARAGAATAVGPLVTELCAKSSEFNVIWHDEAICTFSHSAKVFHHPSKGLQTYEASTFAVDGRPDLVLVVYHSIGKN